MWTLSNHLAHLFRSSHRIPSHWASSADRDEPHSQALSNANLRAQHRRRQVSILVLSDQATKSQEGQWRDCQPERGMSSIGLGSTTGARWNEKKRPVGSLCSSSDSREAPFEGQELWRLATIRLSVRYPQYVQGVSGDVQNRGGRRSLPGYGCQTSSPFPIDPCMFCCEDRFESRC